MDLDGRFSFSMPPGYEEVDTVDQKSFFVSTRFGYIFVTKVPQPTAHISNEQELVEFYKSFQKLTVAENSGIIFKDSTVKLANTVMRTFEFQNEWNDKPTIVENMAVFVDHTAYNFAYAYAVNKAPSARGERDRFFAGISIINMDPEDQLTVSGASSQLGESFGLVFRYVCVAGFVLTIVLWFLKKDRYVQLIKNIFSWAFMLWGGVLVFIYIGNLIFNFNMYSLLVAGAIFLLIGLGLRKVKIRARM